MRCAIYARKSTEDDRHDEDKSTTRQIEHAKGFIEGKGWMALQEHIYQDDGISGAEFRNRPRDFYRKKNKGKDESGD